MWTAKRFLILMGGLLVTLSSYAVYALLLGGIDGLPPLPLEYFPPVAGPAGAQPPRGDGEAEKRLKQAFGAGCEELRRPYRLWLPEKGTAIAAGQFDTEKDGRVRLAPLSLAIYHKTKVPSAYPEISTIRCDVALLTMDKPVFNFSEFNGRKVVKVELQGKTPGVMLRNNRRTPEQSDDVDVLVSNGSLFYEEGRNLVWTDGIVRLTDYQNKPPTIISGRGLEMLLAKDTAPNRPRGAKAPGNKNDDNAGIEQIVLRADVDMHFWVNGKSNFLNGAPENNKPAAVVEVGPEDAASPQDKAHIHIRTGGIFVYDLLREVAWFESPVHDGKGSKHESEQLAPDQVHVQRWQKANGNKSDQLVCDRLDLQFRRSADKTNDLSAGDTGSNKEIETAKATCRPGHNIFLALDSERMSAEGNYLFYRSGDGATGAQTILKGEPLISNKDVHKMRCKELRLYAANKSGAGQSAEAFGPDGVIDFFDSRSPEKYTTHVRWSDKLLMVKDREGNQVLDLIKVYGNASFIDDHQKQQLHGDRLFVWIINQPETEKKTQAASASKQELHRVLAMDHVRAASPEFRILRTDRLTMMFKQEMAPQARLPDVPVAAKTTQPPSLEQKSTSLAPPPAKDAPPAKEAPRPPIDLEGDTITMEISTLGAKKQLQELTAKSNVTVFQPGEKPGEKRIDIHGHLLILKHADKGEILTVHGTAQKLAQVQAGEMIIWGPQVTVNQITNRAEVDGQGVLEMPSKTNLDGTESKKGPLRLRIFWRKNMTFDGKYADFWQDVQAYQLGERSNMKCQNLHARLDRVISFKEGQKNKQEAQIERLICDKRVCVVDVKTNENQQLLQHSILEGQVLLAETQDQGPMRLVGPGVARQLQQGAAEMNVAPGQNTPAAKVEKLVWKLTRVEFSARMFSQTKAAVKNAKFYAETGQLLDVQHFPTTDINAVMNVDRVPKDGFYLRCEILSVEGRQQGEKTSQYMVAERNVSFRTDKYEGKADIVKYDESSDIVIFEALPPNQVHMSEILPNGQRRLAVSSAKVLYNRKTGEMKSEGVKSLTN